MTISFYVPLFSRRRLLLGFHGLQRSGDIFLL
jgi:hypothetical protein